MNAASTTEPLETPAKLPFYINRNFGLLFGGQAISFLGDFVFDTTLVLWIATRIGAGQSWAPLAVSGLLACVAIPSLVGGPIAGVFVDRWDKRRTMLVMDALRTVLILSLVLVSGMFPLPFFAAGALPVAGQLGMIYGVVLLTTMCQQFFSPARMALIGDVVEPSVQARASGMGQVTASLAMIIGPPLAPALLFTFGVQWALIVNALSFVVSFVAILFVHAPPAARSVPIGAKGNLWRELTEGLHFFAANRVLRTILIASIFVMFGAGALNALDIFFVTQNLHTSPHLYGWLSAAFGVGMVVGAILAGVYASRIGPVRLFSMALLVAGVGMTIYARLGSFLPAVILLCAVGIPVAGLNVVVMPLILQTTPRELVGRVSAVLQPAVSLASLASIVLSGIIVSTVLRGFHTSVLGVSFGPVDTIFTVAGLLCITGGIYAVVNLWNLSSAPALDEEIASLNSDARHSTASVS